MIDLDWLERLAKAAPAGKWETWTSNSWRRVYAGGNPAITPCVQRYDNHPDLTFAPGVREWVEAATPDAVSALIAEVRALHEYREMARRQVYELMGVIVDIEQFGSEFDDACMNTIKRVRDQLHGIADTKPCV